MIWAVNNIVEEEGRVRFLFCSSLEGFQAFWWTQKSELPFPFSGYEIISSPLRLRSWPPSTPASTNSARRGRSDWRRSRQNRPVWGLRRLNARKGRGWWPTSPCWETSPSLRKLWPGRFKQMKTWRAGWAGGGKDLKSRGKIFSYSYKYMIWCVLLRPQGQQWHNINFLHGLHNTSITYHNSNSIQILTLYILLFGRNNSEKHEHNRWNEDHQCRDAQQRAISGILSIATEEDYVNLSVWPTSWLLGTLLFIYTYSSNMQ